MLNFRYCMPTQVIFGRNTQCQVGEEIKRRGGTRVLVHYAADAAWARPLLDTVYASLTEAGLAYAPLGGVVPNPRLHKVYEGIELGRREKVDFILAVGGGSVIDSAKAIGYGLMDDGDVWDFYIRKRTPRACMPVGVIPVMAPSLPTRTAGLNVMSDPIWHALDLPS